MMRTAQRLNIKYHIGSSSNNAHGSLQFKFLPMQPLLGGASYHVVPNYKMDWLDVGTSIVQQMGLHTFGFIALNDFLWNTT